MLFYKVEAYKLSLAAIQNYLYCRHFGVSQGQYTFKHLVLR